VLGACFDLFCNKTSCRPLCSVLKIKLTVSEGKKYCENARQLHYQTSSHETSPCVLEGTLHLQRGCYTIKITVKMRGFSDDPSYENPFQVEAKICPRSDARLVTRGAQARAPVRGRGSSASTHADALTY
jgi:hypothetical protein